MKLWKILVLLAGLTGVAGFFFPFIEVTHTRYNARAEISALQLVRGAADYVELAKAHEAELPKGEAQRLFHRIDDKVSAFRGLVVALYVPSGMLALLGLVGVARGRFGRFGGLLALVLGIASAGIWLAFLFVSRQEKDPEFHAALGLGLYGLLVAGLGGIFGGFGALLAPDID
jgi:hypothetical protein